MVPEDGPGREAAEIALRIVAERYRSERIATLQEQLDSEVPVVHGMGLAGPAKIKLPFDVRLYGTPHGQEQSFADDVRAEYLDLILGHPSMAAALTDPGSRMSVAPNLRLYQAGLPDPVPEPFSIGTHHASFTTALGLTGSAPAGRTTTVAVLDNGFDDTMWSGVPSPVPVGSGLDLIPGAAGTSGHGTLVAALISQATSAAFVVPIRMGGSDATEWDAMHALARAVAWGADVVTLCYRQWLTDQQCSTCGLVRQTARSEVFEKLIEWAATAAGGDRAILVAAGNDGVGAIAKPAACPQAIPITALDVTCSSLASFANWDSTGLLAVMALPGEDVAKSTQSQSTFSGTSFATAYAAAMYAEAMARWPQTGARSITGTLKANAPRLSNAVIPRLP